ncbi:MAG: M48 family metallopeptidase [Terracidiphilus sp.]|jgi:Zn-dependent protease with chaperone function
MTLMRRMLPIFCLALLLTGMAPRLCCGQPAPAQLTPAQPAPATMALPAQPASTQAYNLPPEKLAKAITLSHIRLALEIIGSLWGLAFVWLLLSLRWAAGLAAWTERLLRRRWMQGLLFFAVYLVISTVADLPLDAIGHAVSRHYGISVQGWAGWGGDLAKALGLLLLFGTPILLFFNWLVRVSPRRYYIWIWLVSLPLIVLTIFASPLLDPIFNKFEPLTKTHSALVTRLEQVVTRTGTRIPPERMFLMKASVKSNGLNAYVTGIGATKRFVMWDTATDRLPDDEVLFIFGHESGHYVLNHIPKELGGMAAGLFFVFWACAGFAGWLARRYSARWQLGGPEGSTPLASRQGFLVLLFALSVAGIILQPASSTFSRHFEHEADVYGQEAIHGLVADPQKTAVSAFNHLGEAWLEDPNPNAFVEFWTYSHPSVQNRANFALHYDPWVNGGRGRFFEK